MCSEINKILITTEMSNEWNCSVCGNCWVIFDGKKFELRWENYFYVNEFVLDAQQSFEK